MLDIMLKQPHHVNIQPRAVVKTDYEYARAFSRLSLVISDLGEKTEQKLVFSVENKPQVLNYTC